MKAVDVAEKADPSGFILAREERTRLLVRTQRLSDLLRAEDLDVAWYIDAMREPEHIEYAKVFLQTVRKTLSGEIQRFPEDSEVHRTSIKVSNAGTGTDVRGPRHGRSGGGWPCAHVRHHIRGAARVLRREWLRRVRRARRSSPFPLSDSDKMLGGQHDCRKVSEWQRAVPGPWVGAHLGRHTSRTGVS